MDGIDRIILVNYFFYFWGIVVYGFFFYYIDEYYEVIERVDKNIGVNKVVLRDNILYLRGFRVYYKRGKCLRLKYIYLWLL